MAFRISRITCLFILLQSVIDSPPLHSQECHINGANTAVREIPIESIDSHFNFIWAGSNKGLMRCSLSCPYDPPFPLDDKDRQNTYIDDQERARKGNDPTQCKCSTTNTLDQLPLHFRFYRPKVTNIFAISRGLIFNEDDAVVLLPKEQMHLWEPRFVPIDGIRGPLTGVSERKNGAPSLDPSGPILRIGKRNNSQAAFS
jgi:hypothetical protein